MTRSCRLDVPAATQTADSKPEKTGGCQPVRRQCRIWRGRRGRGRACNAVPGGSRRHARLRSSWKPRYLATAEPNRRASTMTEAAATAAMARPTAQLPEPIGAVTRRSPYSLVRRVPTLKDPSVMGEMMASTRSKIGCAQASGRAHALALCRFRRYISANFPTFRSRGFRAVTSTAKVSQRIYMNGRQFIYHMQGLTKAYPAGKKVLDNVHLSFYPDAKIGVLGVNGSGKSTLLRIMAGIDTEFSGEGWVAEGARVGYLEQEPQARRDQDRARERHGRRRRQEGAARPLQRDRRQLFRRDRRRDGEAAGPDRLAEPVGPRQPRSIWRWTRCAARRTTPT